MTAKTGLSAPKHRTGAELQQLVAEFVSSGLRRKRILPESRFELQHSGSPSEEAGLEEKVHTNFFRRSFCAGGVVGWSWCYRACAGSRCILILIRVRSNAWWPSWSGCKPCLD